MFYYWAVSIKNMNFWLDELDKQPNWLKMEKEDCTPFDISYDFIRQCQTS